MKRECMLAPEKLAAEGAALPAPLVQISEHLAGLAFEGDPDYQLLRGCLERLAACPAAEQARPPTARPPGPWPPWLGLPSSRLPNR